MYNLLRMRISSSMTSLRPVVVSGPSGTGKSTLLKKLFKEYPDSFGFCVSHTTRKKRNEEVEGKQYYFTSEEEMKRDIAAGKFVEHAQFSGNYYGTSKAAIKEVLDMKRICILDIDEQGVKSIKASDLEALYIFIRPPSLAELQRRLTSRGTETDESIKHRMETATSAIEYSCQPDSYDFIIENDDLEQTYGHLRNFLKKRFSSVMKNNYDSGVELPLVASIKQIGMKAHEADVEVEDGNGVANLGFTDVDLENSVAGIPLSPGKAASEDQNNAAVVNIGETPLLAISDLPDGNTSSVVVEFEESENSAPSSGVCGTQSWCSLV